MADREQFADVRRRLGEAERALSALGRAVNGYLPQGNEVRTLRDRLEAVERTVAASNVADANPALVPPLAPRADTGTPLFDVEWGKPSETPSGTSATITVRPCKEDGTSYANADTAVLYIRNDRSEVARDDKDWDTDTILSFVRFPWDTTAESAVGVLVGEGKFFTGDGTPDSGGSFTKHYIGASSTPETVAIPYTLDGCLNSLLFIGLDVRECSTGPHPGYSNTLMSGGQYGIAWGNPIATWSGDDSNWMSLVYAATDIAGADIGHGIEAIPNVDIQARVTAAGVLEFQIYNQSSAREAFVVMGAIWRKVCDDPPGDSFGAGS